MMEKKAGLRFAPTPTIPASAVFSTDLGDKEDSPDIAAGSLSKYLMESGKFESVYVPIEHMLSHIETPQPKINAITELELTIVTDKTCEFLLESWGRLDIGRPLARRIASQLLDHIALPKYGRTSGADRKLWMIILQKCKNRSHV
jgi:hypothetical protein